MNCSFNFFTLPNKINHQNSGLLQYYVMKQRNFGWK